MTSAASSAMLTSYEKTPDAAQPAALLLSLLKRAIVCAVEGSGTNAAKRGANERDCSSDMKISDSLRRRFSLLCYDSSTSSTLPAFDPNDGGLPSGRPSSASLTANPAHIPETTQRRPKEALTGRASLAPRTVASPWPICLAASPSPVQREARRVRACSRAGLRGTPREREWRRKRRRKRQSAAKPDDRFLARMTQSAAVVVSLFICVRVCLSVCVCVCVALSSVTL